jgi:triphosphoribosyl-dephospho-CoA synthase
MTAPAGAIAAAFIAACRDELDAPKPGNVHVFADGHRMSVGDFVRSAAAAAGPLTAPGTSVGQRILGAVAATRSVVETNTNLGIVLLCAPLAAAAEAATMDLRVALTEVLESLDIADANLAFQAIALAAPGGLGHAERHDVHASATVTLRQAMAAAADRDRIAYQFSTDFEDIFDRGVGCFDRAAAHWSDPKWATLAVYLGFLAGFPDTHIVRRYGIVAAEDVRGTGQEFESRLQASDDPTDLLADLLAWDTDLKQRGLNPGTTADLTVATLFARRLTLILPPTPNSG